MLDSNTLCNIIKEVFKLDDSHIVLPKVNLDFFIKANKVV